jgi:hypothetical protein
MPLAHSEAKLVLQQLTCHEQDTLHV